MPTREAEHDCVELEPKIRQFAPFADHVDPRRACGMDEAMATGFCEDHRLVSKVGNDISLDIMKTKWPSAKHQERAERSHGSSLTVAVHRSMTSEDRSPLG
jgi:hypothetical protein